MNLKEMEELEATLEKEANSLREKISFLRTRKVSVESPTYEGRLLEVEEQLRQVRSQIKGLKIKRITDME